MSQEKTAFDVTDVRTKDLIDELKRRHLVTLVITTTSIAQEDEVLERLDYFIGGDTYSAIGMAQTFIQLATSWRGDGEDA